jgi:type IV fimbrial biogenesis protein FimT
VLTVRGANPKGFTLVEVLVTLSVFALLIALTVPVMSTWVANAKVRASADALQNGLRMAQAESLRRSRQVVFSLTNSSSPSSSLTAVQNGGHWSLNTIPSMTDGSETSEFIESGTLTTTSANVAISGPAAICFNSMGRPVGNSSTGITGASCSTPVSNPAARYVITLPGADKSLRVEVALGGQVHLCDPAKSLSSSNPDGCQS